MDYDAARADHSLSAEEGRITPRPVGSACGRTARASLGRRPGRNHGTHRPRCDHDVDHPAGHPLRGVAGPWHRIDGDHGRVLPRPLDAAAVHDADDAHPGAEPHPRRDADVQERGDLPVASASHAGAGDGARGRLGRIRRLPELGIVDRAVTGHRHPLRDAGRAQGHQDRFPLVDVGAGGRRGDLAVRPVRQRAAPDGDAGQLSRAAGRRHAAHHHDLVAGGAHPGALLHGGGGDRGRLLHAEETAAGLGVPAGGPGRRERSFGRDGRNAAAARGPSRSGSSTTRS